jgi:hypothetical protein
VVRETKSLVITEIFDFRTTPRHPAYFSAEDVNYPALVRFAPLWIELSPDKEYMLPTVFANSASRGGLHTVTSVSVYGLIWAVLVINGTDGTGSD